MLTCVTPDRTHAWMQCQQAGCRKLMGATAACQGGSLSFSGVDVIALAACTFTNSSVPEWQNSPDAGGQCITGLQLAYTAGAAVFAEDFRAATITSSRSVSKGVCHRVVCCSRIIGCTFGICMAYE